MVITEREDLLTVGVKAAKETKILAKTTGDNIYNYEEHGDRGLVKVGKVGRKGGKNMSNEKRQWMETIENHAEVGHKRSSRSYQHVKFGRNFDVEQNHMDKRGSAGD